MIDSSSCCTFFVTFVPKESFLFPLWRVEKDHFMAGTSLHFQVSFKFKRTHCSGCTRLAATLASVLSVDIANDNDQTLVYGAEGCSMSRLGTWSTEYR